MDKLCIHELKLNTKIGVHTWEQRILQTLLIEISLTVDTSQCNDDINSTLDYSQLCEAVTQFVESNSFNLIETVANQVANLIQEKFNITNIEIKVTKPHAINNARGVSITVIR